MLVMSNLQQHYMIRKLANKSLMPMIEALGIKRKNFDDKALPLCYNQLKALYFCKYDTTAYFSGVYHFEEGRPLRIFRQRHGNFQCFMLPVNSRKIEMSDVKTLREKRGVGILPAFI